MYIWEVSMKKLGLAAGALLLSAGAVFYTFLENSFFVQLAGVEDHISGAVHEVATDEAKVALTFNVSWGDERPEEVFSLLEEENVPEAAFFLSGAWSERHPELVEDINESRYTIGHHGYEYKPYPAWEEEEIMQDLRKGSHTLQEITGEQPAFFRPPAGALDTRVLEAAESQGLTTIQWSVDGQDWENPGTDQVIERISESVSPGAIIMMDASDQSKQVTGALPKILDVLEQQGYDVVGLKELLHEADIEVREL
ncbi:polysaccharide deacetylase family sporulation protein PdaB [Salsuginibacillus halophilus]|uniref:Polysaccharide deacetylase family sporulation protein PdaB n=1 Tax=Salsuginibacillus halophilus TaxID=517424 RepID=A0A2P8H8T9_9BACI|nr:polysaccharide deacetylase family protein [Salsuginibacillus halophilus]PSL42611.1 polysaccharide deacetylase family sporulation protein PdaB [Salsuginibacillus halophilus]